MYSRRRFGSRSLTLGFTFGRNIRSRATNGSLNLKPSIEEKLTARAKAEGLTTEEFANRELEKLLASQPRPLALTPQERARRWREWIDNHSVGGPPLSDYAVSRESIYKEREDAQL